MPSQFPSGFDKDIFGKKRYWRLVSDYSKLRNFQSIRKPCNDDAHGYVISTSFPSGKSCTYTYGVGSVLLVSID